jgi:hypothetical protein
MRLPWIAALMLASACSRAGDESEAKRSPKTPPPATVTIPPDLRIEVEVDGRQGAPITAATLGALAPDFADEERSAWKLTALLGPPFEKPGALAEAQGKDGQGVLMTRPEKAGGPEPVLFLTRRGEIVAATVDPAQPFPSFHGHGGQLQRPGDRRPRLNGVVRLRVRSDAGGQAGGDGDRSGAGRQALLALKLVVGGQPRTLTAEQLGALPRLNIQGDQGDQRAAWSLRDLVAAVGGADARVTSVTGEGGATAVAPERWQDVNLTPLLRANKRGELKLVWLDATGTPSLEGEVRAVTAVEIKP